MVIAKLIRTTPLPFGDGSKKATIFQFAQTFENCPQLSVRWFEISRNERIYIKNHGRRHARGHAL